MTMLPSSSIYTNLVAQTIGEGSNDVGKLCSSPHINSWSKWKPSILRGNGGYDAGRQLIDGMFNVATKHYIINQKNCYMERWWNTNRTSTYIALPKLL